MTAKSLTRRVSSRLRGPHDSPRGLTTPRRTSSPDESLVRDLSLRLAGRISRRSLVTRAGVAGAALTFAPLRYLLKPDPAFAAAKVPCLCGGNDCSNGGSKCCDGYTEFCVTLSGRNVCPDGTFIGGYWRCKDYNGTKYCADTGKRFYYDCQSRQNGDWTCHCASGECDCRAVRANHFRYANCNPQIDGKHFVVCRIVTCTPPWNNGLRYACSKSRKKDFRTCPHEPCHGW